MEDRPSEAAPHVVAQIRREVLLPPNGPVLKASPAKPRHFTRPAIEEQWYSKVEMLIVTSGYSAATVSQPGADHNIFPSRHLSYGGLFSNFDRFEKSPIVGEESDDALSHQPDGLDAVEEKPLAHAVSITSQNDHSENSRLGNAKFRCGVDDCLAY